jgi:hypothetical protein
MVKKKIVPVGPCRVSGIRLAAPVDRSLMTGRVAAKLWASRYEIAGCPLVGRSPALTME